MTATMERTEPATQTRQRPGWQLVASRELIVRLTDRAFIVTTLFSMFALLASFGVQALMFNRSHHYNVGVVDTASKQLAQTADQADQNDKTSITPVDIPNLEQGKQDLKSGKLDAVLTRDGDHWQLLGDKETQSSLEDAVSTVVTQQTISPQQARAMTVDYQLLDTSAQDSVVRQVTAFVFAFIFYLASLTFGIQIAQSVVQEKQSRIVEIIAASIPLRLLLMGKVLANTVLALAQTLIYVAIGLVGLSFTSYKALIPEVTGASAWFVVFFLAGFIALACLWAMAGSLASRMEDVGQTSGPISMLVMAAFFGGIFLDGGLLRIASYVPIVSSIAMPRRLLMGGVPVWEPILALLITAAFAAFTIWFGARVYRRALMQTSKLSVKQALKAEL